MGGGGCGLSGTDRWRKEDTFWAGMLTRFVLVCFESYCRHDFVMAFLDEEVGGIDFLEERNEIEERGRLYELELEDVIGDISDFREDEDDPVLLEHQDVEPSEDALIMQQRMYAVQVVPREDVPIFELYLDKVYRDRAEEKLAKMRQILERTDVDKVLRGKIFWEELERIRNLYGSSQDDGRGCLNELIALCHRDRILKDHSERDDDVFLEGVL